MRKRLKKIATATLVAVVASLATVALLAQSVTPWQVGDVFVGVGSNADSSGVYKTVDGTGHVKVPDLNTGTSWTTGCFVDPTVPAGDLWTASWTDMTLSHFDGTTHALIDAFNLVDANGLATPLAALPRSAGVAPLPDDAIGTYSPNDVHLASVVGPTPVLVDRSTSPATVTTLTGKVLPAIQAVDQVLFATSGPYKGQMYIGTNVPPDNSLGRGHGYLLRLQYTPAVTGTNPAPSHLTLTGWWTLDAGALSPRTPPSGATAIDIATIQDGTSNGASGVDFIDLSSDQETIFYTSQDHFIRSVNVVTGAIGTPIPLTQSDGTNPDGSAHWADILDARALGVRALPGKVDATGTLDPTAGGDGTAGFLVASSGGYIYRVDQFGHSLYRYTMPGRPAPITITPDAQYFWTATTQDDPFFAQPAGGFLYRFHIASGVVAGPFSPYGPPFPAGVTDQGHGVYGLCMNREFYAGAASGDHQQACFAMNADGSPQLVNGNPVPDVCRTPALCSPFVRGVALSPSGTALGPDDPANANCYPPGAHKPTFADQHNHEGDTVSVDLTQGNPDLLVDGVAGLPLGLHFAGGVVSGTIDVADCAIQNGTCSHPITVLAHFSEDVDASGNTIGSNGAFTWAVDDGNSAPTLALKPNQTLAWTALKPGVDIELSVFDRDAVDADILRITGAPPGLGVTGRTGSGSGFAAAISGTPGADPPYDHVYHAVLDLFDCSPVWADLHAADATVADLQSAMTAGNCYHHVQLPVTITIVNILPTFNAAIPNQFSTVHAAVPGLTVTASDADQHLPIRFRVTGLPAGLDYCHLDPATRACPTAPSDWHNPIASNLNPNAQMIRIFGTPTTAVNDAPVNVTITDAAFGSTQASFTWSVVTNNPPVCSGSASPALLWPPDHKLVPFSIVGVTDADNDPLTITITRITQDQPLNATGDGNTVFDASGVGTTTAAVRAERTGNLRVPDDGRLYQIDYMASDGKPGGTCAGTAFVGVPHDQGQHSLPSDNQCRWDSVTGAHLGACAWLHAPVLTLTSRTNRQGDAVNLQIVAVDPDGTPLTYTASGLPPGLTMSSSGLITGTVAAGAAGKKGATVYTVTVAVDDGYGGDPKTFAWTILGS